MGKTKPIKLELKGGMATAGPPVATSLGSCGVNTRDFVLQFNAMTEKQRGELLRVWVTVSSDKKFKIQLKGSPTSVLIKEAANIKKGSGEPNRNKVGSIDIASVDKIITKAGDNIRGFTQEARRRVVEGVARSMGVEINK